MGYRHHENLQLRLAILAILGQGMTQVELARGLAVSPLSIRNWREGLSYGVPWRILRAMWQAEPSFARIAQEIWRRCT